MSEAIEEFRSGFGRGLTVATALIAVVTTIVVAASSGFADALLTLPWLALFVVCAWATFWRPGVVVSDAGVRLVNVTRTIDLPWPAVNAVDTRFALTLHTAYGRFAAWAAPAPGAGTALRSSMRMRSRNHPADGSDECTEVESSTMGDLAGTSSGDAATIVRRRWERLSEHRFLDNPQLEFDRAPVAWHWRVGALVAALGALSVATLFVA